MKRSRTTTTSQMISLMTPKSPLTTYKHISQDLRKKVSSSMSVPWSLWPRESHLQSIEYADEVDLQKSHLGSLLDLVKLAQPRRQQRYPVWLKRQRARSNLSRTGLLRLMRSMWIRSRVRKLVHLHLVRDLVSDSLSFQVMS